VNDHLPIVKVERLAAGVLLILRSVGLVTGQICRCRICTLAQPMRTKGLQQWPIRRRELWQNTRQ